MGFLLWFVGCATWNNSSAGDRTDSSSYEDNRIDTLHYRPPQKGINPVIELSTRLNDAETVTQSGQTTATVSRASFASSLGISYGVVDDFLVGISEGYLFSLASTRTAQPSGAVTNPQSLGLTDPTFHANYRYLGSLKGAFFGSAFLTLTPSVGAALVAGTIQTGNNLSGLTTVTGGTALYWVSGIHEWEAQATASYLSAGTFTAETTAGSYTTNSLFKFSLTAAYRLHLGDAFYLSGSVGATTPYTSILTYANQTPVLTQNADYPIILSPALTAGLRADSNVVLYVRYTHTSYARNLTPSSGTASTTNVALDLLYLGASVEF